MIDNDPFIADDLRLRFGWRFSDKIVKYPKSSVKPVEELLGVVEADGDKVVVIEILGARELLIDVDANSVLEMLIEEVVEGVNVWEGILDVLVDGLTEELPV